MKGLHIQLVLYCLCAVLVGTGCSEQTQSVTITMQYGTAYAPIALMQEQGLLEQRLPENIQINWSQMGNTATIREAMLAGKTDIACMAIPPFLIGRDAGMEWKICSGVSRIPMGLVSRDASLQSIGDITESMRIALPQPGSIQHILLAMAAGRELDAPTRFDNQLVTMSHPDGMSALLSDGEVALHFTTAPYLQQELDAGMHLLLAGEKAMGGPFTGIVAVTGERFRAEHPTIYKAFLDALAEATTRLTEDPAGCAEQLAAVYGMTPAELEKEITAPGTAYDQAVDGVPEFQAFMRTSGYLSATAPMEELLFEEALA